MVDLSPNTNDPREEARNFEANLACKGTSDDYCCELGFRKGERALRVALEKVPAGDPTSPTCAREMTEGSALAIHYCSANHQISPPEGIQFANKRASTGNAYCSENQAREAERKSQEVAAQTENLDRLFRTSFATQTQNGQFELHPPRFGGSLESNSPLVLTNFQLPSLLGDAWFETPLSPTSVFSFKHSRSEAEWSFGRWLREMELSNALSQLAQAKSALKAIQDKAVCTQDPDSPLPDQKYQGCFVSGFSNILHTFLPTCEEKILEEAARLNVGDDPSKASQAEKKPEPHPGSSSGKATSGRQKAGGAK